MLYHMRGDLLALAEQGEFDIIVHGCNCFHTMASGIAGQIASKYPIVTQADKTSDYASRSKLGDYTYAFIQRLDGSNFQVINAYTQYDFSRGRDVFEYEAFDTFLKRLRTLVFTYQTSWSAGTEMFQKDRAIRIGFPYIGCGLAGGDEKEILLKLEDFAQKAQPWAKTTIVEFIRRTL